MRKFLLKNNDILTLLYEKKIPFYKSNITQFYSKFNKFKKEKFIKKDENYTILTKTLNDKFSINITKEEFEKALRISLEVRKTIYRFSFYECDFVLNDYKDMFILDVFSKDNKFLEILNNLDFKEITNDKSYKDLLFFKPLNLNFNNKEIFLNIKNSPFLKLSFPDFMDSYKAFLFLFNQLNLQILATQENYFLTKRSEFLFNLRQNTKSNLMLLEVLKDLLNEEMFESIKMNLKQNLDTIDEIYKLNSLINYLKTIKNSKNAVKSLEFVLKNQNEFLGFKKDLNFEIFLKDFDEFYKNGSIILKKFIAKKIRTQIVLVQKSFFKLSSESLNSEFFEFRDKIQLLNELLFNFKDMFGLKQIDKLYKKTFKISFSLENLAIKNSWCKIINLYDKGENKAFLNNQKDEISVFMFEIRTKILFKKSNFIDEARKVFRVLKPYY